jgi:hypothetical protein
VPRQVAECGVACCWPAPTISRLRSGRGVSPVSHVIRPPTPRVFRHQHHQPRVSGKASTAPWSGRESGDEAGTQAGGMT